MPESLSRSRLDSFSDGVMAVIITIMVLELKVPNLHEASDHEALRGNLRMLVVYLLSFVQTGIYWVNHHYLMDDVEQVSHGVLWANLVFLFTLSLIPFGTAWIGIRGVTAVPVAVYVFCFFVPSVSWVVLAKSVSVRSGVRPAAGPLKQTVSVLLDLGAMGVAFVSAWGALAMVAVVAIMWLVPPKRIVEKTRGAAPTGASSR